MAALSLLDGLVARGADCQLAETLTQYAGELTGCQWAHLLASVLHSGTATMARMVLELGPPSQREALVDSCGVLPPGLAAEEEPAALPALHGSQGLALLASLPVLGLALRSHDPGMAAVVRAAGAAPTCRDLALAACCHDVALACRLLARGRPQVPSARGASTHCRVVLSGRSGVYIVDTTYSCPLLACLEVASRPGQVGATDELRAVRLMELLVQAGYSQPTVYCCPRLPIGHQADLLCPQFAAHWAAAAANPAYDPLVESAEDFNLKGKARHVALAMQRPLWAPAIHNRWPPAFHAAVRQVLKAAAVHFGSDYDGSSGSGSDGLPALPPELVLRVVGMAAYPLSAWL